MPTGIALRDARRQLFDAAERVLVRDGVQALTSRAVTTEAGCAKGVLHRHFSDFDAFLAEWVLDRIVELDHEAVALRNAAGTATVVANLVGALMTVFSSVGTATVSLITTRDAMRARLRQNRPNGVPVLTEAVAMITLYLTAERELGRVAQDSDVETLAFMVIGAAHMLFAADDHLPSEEAVVRLVTTVIAASLLQPER